VDNKKITIIGAGIAGLAAGCYARMNGYEAEIYEAHSIPGGLCTSWKRKGYTIDGCIHWLTGSSPVYSFYKVWEELGAVQGRNMINHDIFTRFNSSDGRVFSVYSDVERLEKHMLELSPADSAPIKTLCRLTRRFTGFQMPVGKPFELFSPLDYIPRMLKMLPFSRDLNYCNSITIGDFAAGFKDPFLRENLPRILSIEDYPLFSLVVTLAMLHIRTGGFPQGGSLEFARAIETRYRKLGGKILYNQQVEQILEENSKAVGIRLADGRIIKSDYVISAADLHATLYQMLEGRHIDPMHAELFRTCRLAPSSVQVSFGVDMDLASPSPSLSEWFQLDKPLIAGNQSFDWIGVKNYCYDKTLAPAGKSVVVCNLIMPDYSYWENLAGDKQKYRAEKEKIAAAVIGVLSGIYPGFQSRIEATDVATPITYVRYTGNWKGTYMTWIIPPDKVKRFRMVKKTVPGLENFWLSGMWVQPPGGVPTGAMTSRDILQIICKMDGRRFITTKG